MSKLSHEENGCKAALKPQTASAELLVSKPGIAEKRREGGIVVLSRDHHKIYLILTMH